MGMPGQKRQNFLRHLLQNTSGPEQYRGFLGIHANAADEFIDSFYTKYSLNISGRTGLYGNKTGYIVTRNGFAKHPKFGWATWDDGDPTHPGYWKTNNPTRLAVKWFPTAALAPTGQLVRLSGALFQYNNNDGVGWVTPAGAGTLDSTQYPQWLIFGAPGTNKTFVFCDLVNGLCCFDGTNFWQQSIPLPGGGNVTGLMWLAQSEGKLFTGGDYVDAAGRLVIFHCKAGDIGDPLNPGDTTNWEDPHGGYLTCYAGDRFSEGTRTTGLLNDQGRMWVFTENGRYVITNAGLDDQNIDFVPEFGCISAKMMWSNKGYVYWWDKFGCYEWAGGGNPRVISREVFPLLSSLKFKNSSGTFIAHNYFSFVYLDQYATVVRTDLEGVTGDELNTWFVFDLITRQWNVWGIEASCAFVADAYTDLGQLYFASPKAVGGFYYVHRFGADDQTGLPIYDDDGSDIVAIYKTGKLSKAQEFGIRKQYHFFRNRVGVSGTSGAIGAKMHAYMNDDDDLIGSITMTNGSDAVVGVSTKFTRDFVVGNRIALNDQKFTYGIILTITDDTNIVLTANYTGTTGSGDYCKPRPFTWPTDPSSAPFHKMGFTERPYGYFCTLELEITSQRRTEIKSAELLYKIVDVDQDTPG